MEKIERGTVINHNNVTLTIVNVIVEKGIFGDWETIIVYTKDQETEKRTKTSGQFIAMLERHNLVD